MQRATLVASAAALFLLGSTATPTSAQGPHSDYDDVDPWVGFQSPEPAADSAAVARFLKALAASDPLVCQLSVSSIGNHWGPGDDALQIGLLAGETRLTRERDALGRSITDPAALGLLSSTLSDPNPCVRRAAARLLGNSETAESVRQLRTALRSRDPRMREAAALGLADAEHPASLHDLAQALKDSDQSVIRMAAYALGELEDARAVKPLGQLLSSKDAATRATAAWALGQIEDIRSAERLTPLVKDNDPGVRLAAVEALGEIEDYRSTGALTEALKDSDVRVRRAAAEALGEVEDQKAAGALEKALEDKDPVVRRLAAQSLGELDGLKRAPGRLVGALADRDQQLAIIAARSLGEIGDTTVVPALSTAYGSENPRLRFSVVSALADLDDERGNAVLGQARKDPDQIVRHKASEVLRDREDDDD
jgi:HEAT repeat protein